MGKEEESYCSEEPGKTFGDGRASEEVIEMVRKKVVGVRGGEGSEDNSKHNPNKSVGKELLKRVREFKERGEKVRREGGKLKVA